MSIFFESFLPFLSSTSTHLPHLHTQTTLPIKHEPRPTTAAVRERTSHTVPPVQPNDDEEASVNAFTIKKCSFQTFKSTDSQLQNPQSLSYKTSSSESMPTLSPRVQHQAVRPRGQLFLVRCCAGRQHASFGWQAPRVSQN